MKSLNEIAEQITHHENCEELIERLTRKCEGHAYEAWKLNKRIDDSEEKHLALSSETFMLELELETLSAVGEEASWEKLIKSRKLEDVKLKKESVSPDSMAFPMFQLHLITSQRVATEEFVSSLQKRLKKLSGDTSQTLKTKPTTIKGRQKKAA